MDPYRIQIRIKSKHSGKGPQLAGMLRGLEVSFEGYSSISGMTNSHFDEHKWVRFYFRDGRKAAYFVKIVKAVFGKYVEVRAARDD